MATNNETKTSTFKVGVMGAGAVGCYIGGRLAAKGTDVVFIGRDRLKREIDENGLTVAALDEESITIPPGKITFETDVARLAECDVVLCCVKSGATIETAERIAKVMPPNAIIVSFQNGVRNAEELRARTKQTVLAGCVNFNILAKGKGVFRRATSGPLIFGASDHPNAEQLHHALVASGFVVERVHDMPALQWSKLLINLNNAVSALSDRPTKELVLTAGYRKVLGAVVKESLAVLRAAKIKPAKLGPIPISFFPIALSLPTPIVRLVARAQLKIDPEARSSMWEDLTNNRPTEVDWLNGEVVRLAETHHVKAPLNQRVVEIVHEAEKAGKGPPKLSPEDLWQQLHT